MNQIILASLWAANARPLCQAVADYLARTGLPVVLEPETTPWQEQRRMLERGAAQVGFVCGLPYVQQHERLELLVAPVMAGPRYGGRPVYFSDVVVRRASPFQRFADLRGRRWAINEPGSFSGYVAVRAHLAAIAAGPGYFGQVVESGAHLRSLELIIADAIDAAAIDSTVLEMELARRPELTDQIRTIATIGPSPIPPLVVAHDLPAALRAQLRAALLAMHSDPAGAAALKAALVSHFVAVSDQDYDPIRRRVELAEQVALR